MFLLEVGSVYHTPRLLPGLLAVAALLGSARLAHADGTWCVLSFTQHGVEATAVHTFSGLFVSELQQQAGVVVITGESTCPDADCALGVARLADAEVAVFGSVGALGSKIVVTVTAVEVESERLLGSQRVTLDRVEDLDTAAARLAEALAEGEEVGATARLGNLTAEESKPARRREGRLGPSLRVGSLAPISDGYAHAGAGILLDAGLWYETLDFAVEARTGVRFDADAEEPNAYVEVPIDLGAYWLLGRGDFSLLVGGGAGVRYLLDERLEHIETGRVIQTRTEKMVQDSAWAFGWYGRAGVMLLRTYAVRLMLVADWNMLLAKLHGQSNPQSLTFSLGIIL